MLSISKRLIWTAGVALLWTCLAGLPLLAQSYYGVIRGLVTDPNEGSVATAKVTIINEATSEQRVTNTSSVGEYVFNEVVPATYTVVCESPGFKKYERKGIVVATQAQVTADARLEVGQVTDSVQVTEVTPLVESANASQGQILDNQKLSDLPNLGRNPFMMSKLTQNIVQVGNPAYNRMEDQSGSSQISIAGGPVRGNNYLIDGVPITDTNNRAIIIPTIEAVQEVKIQSNTYDAEMARTGGGMFNTLMKSGANEFHGSLYGHHRQTSTDANSFFNNAAGIPIIDQPNDTWGASFGGPVWLPKIYNGKNKTFFYLGYEHYDDIQSSSSVFAVPTPAEVQGNFSQALTASGAPLTIYDPLNVVNGVRQPFPGNIIPTSRLNPVGLAIANNFQTSSTQPYFGDPTLNAPGRLPARAAQYTGKLDEDFTSWWRMSLSYQRYYSLEPGNTEFPTPSSPNNWRLQRRVDATEVNSLFTINPTTVLSLRYGFNRFPNFDYNASQGYNLASLGFPSSLVNAIPSAISQFPPITMTDLYSLVQGAGDNNSFVDLDSKNFSTTISKYMGRHSLKAGFDYRRLEVEGADYNNAGGQYTFNGIFTQSNPTSTGVGGADLADLLLGYPHDGAIFTATNLYEFSNYFAWFIQDDFRVTSRLTVNAGLRWEHESGLAERNNGMVVNFNGAVANPLAANVSGISPMGEVVYAGNGRTTAGNPYSSKWGPRVGLAYQLNSKTVVRAGYGIFFAPQYALGSPLATVGYNQTTPYIATTNNFQTSAGSLSNPFPNGILPPVGKSLGALTAIGQSFSLIDPNARSPYVQQYSLDIQRELPFGIATEVGFVGSKSSHLVLGEGNINENALNPALLSLGPALTQNVPNPFYGHGGTGVIGTPTVQQSQLLLPYPTYGEIEKTASDNNKAKYYSLVMKAQKRFSHGLNFLSTFTWSRNWDESTGGAGNTLNGGNLPAQNPYNLAGEYSFANIDSPFRWSTSVSYELPFGKGKEFANNVNTALDYVVGGWVLNTVSVFQTGFPLEITQATNFNSAFGYDSQRPNATGVSPVTSGSLEARLNNYINPAAFSTAPEFTFGNISRTIDMRGPGQVNWDMSLFKNFVIKERFKAQFRFEALNAMNTPLFYGPNVSFGSSQFGKITSQANFARQLEFALRFSF